MIKQYQFRLEPVLKLRKLKEENCRTELGKLITELRRIDDQLAHDKAEIENYYKVQESAMKSGISGSQLQAFPMLVTAKEKNIQLLLLARSKQLVLIEKKKVELAQLKGDLKVMENLKEKGMEEHRKSVNKEIDQKVEEQTQIWMNYKDKQEEI